MAGDWLFREGDPGDALYVLRSGRLEIVQEAGGNETVIRSLPSGAVLGELALLTRAPRSASARARRDSTLLAVSREAFLDLLESDPAFATALSRTMADLLAAHPGGGHAARAGAAGDRRGHLLRARGRGGVRARAGRAARERRAARAADRRRRRGAAASRELLDRCERANDQVLLHADPTRGDEWDAFCLRQADRVLVGGRRRRSAHGRAGRRRPGPARLAGLPSRGSRSG